MKYFPFLGLDVSNVQVWRACSVNHLAAGRWRLGIRRPGTFRRVAVLGTDRWCRSACRRGLRSGRQVVSCRKGGLRKPGELVTETWLLWLVEQLFDDLAVCRRAPARSGVNQDCCVSLSSALLVDNERFILFA